MRSNALLAVCRTAYRRVMAETEGDISAAKQAVRVELQRAGFQVAADDEKMTKGMATVIVMLADGHYVQRGAFDRWYVKLCAARFDDSALITLPVPVALVDDRKNASAAVEKAVKLYRQSEKIIGDLVVAATNSLELR